jgi:hypothetical protein
VGSGEPGENTLWVGGEGRLRGKVGSGWCVVGSGEPGENTLWVWGEGRDEAGTRSAEPWVGDYRIRYCLSSEKLRAVD